MGNCPQSYTDLIRSYTERVDCVNEFEKCNRKKKDILDTSEIPLLV